jgi:hypothetical protein
MSGVKRVLELGNKADLLEIGRVKKVESGKEARDKQLGVMSQNDTTLEQVAPISTRAEIAKAAGVSTGQAIQQDEEGGAWQRRKDIFGRSN